MNELKEYAVSHNDIRRVVTALNYPEALKKGAELLEAPEHEVQCSRIRNSR